ncbi:uncharacterized protein HMPREF1541_02959 [Cyphellophora europaea CBS 101466]|uniref:Ketoreductase (KR) domain-containing protein n=1 Tax=Cyphellophora europaea (strain CBS 101466) TaxID=1220924 RepID=W2RXH9_CYPE1|nr:uncharacterized protein HMPREF1541_02959 [Cyphellophora europaea CBS 101466]ETN41025.1 hypothetical protein HMPREF1541_02959 [Cyphellophora europaea CBS 101466]
MVSLPLVESSNALISSTLPGPLTAIFVGGTKGIGAHTLRAFARHTAALAPTVYLIARSPAAGAAVVAECRALCPSGTFVFMPADVGLMREVDRVCAEIAARERSVNVVFMSQGSFDLYARTDEGLGVMGSLAYYSRVRFARQLLPLLQRAEGLRRVVNVFTGTKEGPLDQEDIDCLRLKGPSGIMKARGHAASLLTLGLECLAQEAPDVGFVHNFPGFVNTDLGDTMPGLMGVAMRAMGRLVGTWKALSVLQGIGRMGWPWRAWIWPRGRTGRREVACIQ